MATITYTIKIDSLAMDWSRVRADVLAHVSDRVQDTAEQVLAQWQDAVMKARGIWQPERQAYVDSLTWRWRDVSHLSAVVETNLPLAAEIENGRPAKDLKRMLLTSPRARDGKNGKYLVIPFRHNTPGNAALAPAMPRAIHKQAKYLTPSGGSRLPAGLAPKMKPHHSTDIFAGMVRLDTSTGKAKSSQYLTYRVMSQNQAGKWLVPAKPGLHLAQAAAQQWS